MNRPSGLGRLTRRRQFLDVANGRKAARAGVVVQARPSAEAGPLARFGVTATKKIGCAVVRNRAKRRLRALARMLLPEFGRAGVDYVFIARDATAERAWDRLLDDAKSALLSLAPAANAERRDDDGGRPPA